MNVFIIAALSADGFLADKQDEKSTNWTSKEDFAFFVEKTKAAGVCIMGSTTYKTIGHPLKDRHTIVYTNHPETIKVEPGVEVTHETPTQLVSSLSAIGYTQVAICGGSRIYTLFMKAGLVNTLYLTYEPILFGDGIKLFDETLGHQPLQLKTIHSLSDQTKVFEFYVPSSQEVK